MDLCGPIRIASINGKRYILVIVDDYSRYTWVYFLRSKDEAPEVIITFLKRITVILQSPVIIIRTYNGTEFKNQVLKVYFDSVGISHKMSSVRTPQQNGAVIQICLWCVDSGCFKHMTGNLKLLINFVWKFMGTIRFGNDHVAAILGFEVAFRRDACFVRNLEGADLLKGDRSTNLYTINLYEMASASPICLMARASSTKSWLWHQRLSHLNFDTINDHARNDLVAVERRNRTLVEAARTMLIFSRAPLFLWAEAIATACFTQNSSIIHRRFNKTPYELINGRKLDISFLYVFGALCYPKNDREDIRKLGAKGDIGFFIGYSADSCAYRTFNRRTKKIIETMNVSFDELFAMAFEQRSSKLGLNSMTYGHISSGLDLTYAPSTITMQQPSEGELDLLFEAMYDDYIGGPPSATARTVPPAQEPQVR
nr:retrovirus-related Pol polyprotein from transposon TNT 1-94 [Tanacetum cinerariifolium]